MIRGMELARFEDMDFTRHWTVRSAAVTITLGIALAFMWAPGQASRSQDVLPLASGTTLCTTRIAARHAAHCSPHGPAASANGGQVPLPTTSSDQYLGFIANDYLYVNDGPIDIYADYNNGEGAVDRQSSVADGFVYLSAYDRIETDQGAVYRTPTGYVNGGSVSRVELPYLRGLSFYRTPERAFGWITSGGTCSQRTPGGSEDFTGRCYVRYRIFQVQDRREIDDLVWYEIAPGEWVEQRLVSIVEPEHFRPDGVEGDRWISVNLYEQTVTAYEDGELVFATLASTGRYGVWTQPGTFQVWAKLERDDMTGGLEDSFYFLQNVPWVLYFDNARALHGTYWHDKFGTPTSRGCVNLSPADAEWVYEFAEEGTWVHVWDPSGETPTDPNLYGAGGA